MVEIFPDSPTNTQVLSPLSTPKMSKVTPLTESQDIPSSDLKIVPSLPTAAKRLLVYLTYIYGMLPVILFILNVKFKGLFSKNFKYFRFILKSFTLEYCLLFFRRLLKVL